MQHEMGQTTVDSLTRPSPPFYQHQFFPGGGGRQSMHPDCLSLSVDHADGPWSSPTNWDSNSAQGAEYPSHSIDWDMKAWNWDSVTFVAQPASGVAGGSTIEGTRRHTTNGTGGSYVPEIGFRLDSSSVAPDQTLGGFSNHKEHSESDLRSQTFFGSETPSPPLNETKTFMRDDASPEEEDGSLSLKLGGNLYSYAEDSGSRRGKRYRSSSPQGQSPMCQVDGCRADLSKAKDYHRRHKVCEMHSKAAKAPVSRLMQRFCQQCSRFHPLPEFDEGKRSCRRRLAGHNRRRRKTQPDAAAAQAYLMAEEDWIGKGSGFLSFLSILSQLQASSSLDRAVGAANDRDVLLQCLKKAGFASTRSEDLSRTVPAWMHMNSNVDRLPSGVTCRADPLVQATPSHGNVSQLSVEAQALLSRLTGPSAEALSLLLQGSLKGEMSATTRDNRDNLVSNLQEGACAGPFTGASSSGTEVVKNQAGPSHRYLDLTSSTSTFPLSSPMPSRPPASMDVGQSSSRLASTLQQLIAEQSARQTNQTPPCVGLSGPVMSAPAVQVQLAPQTAVENRSTVSGMPDRSQEHDRAVGSTVDIERQCVSLADHSMRLSRESLSFHPHGSTNLQQPQLQQVSDDSHSGSDQQSPNSLSADWEDRTGRISFKLFDRNPAELPQALRTQILEWLAHRPSNMESYIRPGCVVLTIFLSMRKSAWAELVGDLRGSLEKLLRSSDEFWCKGRILVQVEHQTVFILDGEIVESRELRPLSYPYLQSVRPLAIVAGQQSDITLKGFNLSVSGTRVLCAYQGKYTLHEVPTVDQDETDGPVTADQVSDVGEDQVVDPVITDSLARDSVAVVLDNSFTICGEPSDVAGRCFIEVEQDTIGGNWKPVIVADGSVCRELRMLEEEIEDAALYVGKAAEKEGLQHFDILDCVEVIRLMVEREVSAFLEELGWFFQKRSPTNSEGSPDLDIVHSTRLQHLLVRSVERGWCAVVRKLLDIPFGVQESDAVFSRLSHSLQEVGLLHCAVRRKYRPMVELLLAYVPSALAGVGEMEFKNFHRTMQFKLRWGTIFRPDMPGPGGLTPLHIAASMQDAEEIVDALTSDPWQVGLHAWVNKRDETGETPLTCALARGNFKSLQLVRTKLARLQHLGSTTIDMRDLPPQPWYGRPNGDNWRGVQEGPRKQASSAKAVELPLWVKNCSSAENLESSKHVPSSCRHQGLGRMPTRISGIRSRSHRAFLLSIVAIAAVCVCVCLVFKGPPQVRFVLLPFRWESLGRGSI